MTLTITRFTDKTGAAAIELTQTWAEFVGYVSSLPPQPVKDDSPLIKLARFGATRTGKGCLRHDENVIEITGIEGDYDDGEVTPEEAVTRLERAGVRALVVTTHSHTPDRPRWRVLAPISAAMPASERHRLVGRLNGALHGCLARESFARSQSFYIGGRPGGEYITKATFDDPDDGEFIDRIDALDQIARFPESGKGHGAEAGKRVADADLLAELLAGESVHERACVITARMVAHGVSDDVIRATFGVLADQVETQRGRERAARLRGHELDELIEGAHRKGFAPKNPQEAFDELAKRIDAGGPEDLESILQGLAKARLSRSREELLLKQMKTRFDVNLRALRGDLMAEKDSSSDGERDHLTTAREVIAHMGTGSVLFSQSTFWRWDDSGVWVPADDRVIKQVAHSVIDGSDKVTRALVDGVADVIKTELFAADAPFDRQDWRCVNVVGGTLRLEDGVWRLDPHNREDYLTTQIPVAYDPDAKCPRFAQFLQEIFAGDADAREKARCVVEAIGYTLLTTCRFEKFFMLIGSGANGKSVLLGVLEALVGSKYVAAVQPSQFENRFQRAHLHGRLANIVTEIAEGAEIADAQLKSIVSGELTTAEHKMKPPFDFRPYATCWFGTNHRPHTRDFSDALFRRAIVLTFNRKFYGSDRDPHLKDRLIAELPGILAVSLKAIAAVIQRGEFTIPASSLDAAHEWRIEADQVAQFVEDACTVGARFESTSADLYRAYQGWCENVGIRKTLNRKNFTNRLERLGMRAGKGTAGVRMIHGVCAQRFEVAA